MAQPTVRDVHIDMALTDFSIAYIQEPGNFIAAQVFPIKPVPHMTNKYWIFNKNDWLRNDAVKKRAAGAFAPRSGFTTSSGSYDASPYWTEVPLNDMVVANADPSLPLDQAATRLVSQRGMIQFDSLFVTNAFTTGVWGTDYVAGTDFTAWDDYSSDPQRDIDQAQETILQNTGREPNCLTVGYKVHKSLKRHPIIKDMYKYTSAESITSEMIAKALDLDKYIVAKAAYATNVEAGTASYSFIAGNHALLSYSDGSPSIMEPCAGATFAWTDLTAVNAAGISIDQYYDARSKDDVVRGQFAFDPKITGSDLGGFFQNAVTTG